MYAYVRATIVAFAYNGFFLFTILVVKGLINTSKTTVMPCCYSNVISSSHNHNPHYLVYNRHTNIGSDLTLTDESLYTMGSCALSDKYTSMYMCTCVTLPDHILLDLC